MIQTAILRVERAPCCSALVRVTGSLSAGGPDDPSDDTKSTASRKIQKGISVLFLHVIRRAFQILAAPFLVKTCLVEVESAGYKIPPTPHPSLSRCLNVLIALEWLQRRRHMNVSLCGNIVGSP